MDIEVEADVPSVSLGRTKLDLQYACSLKSNPRNPAYWCVFQPLSQLYLARSLQLCHHWVYA